MGKKGSAWLFLGPEIGEKQTAIDEIRKEKSSLNTEEIVYYSGETTVPIMVSNIQNGSLFSDSRIFIIKCAEAIKKKEETELLSSCISSVPNDTFLILCSEETGISRGLEKSVPQANKRIFWELSDSRKSEWIRNFFKKEGFAISGEGIETIMELVENNTAALRQECSRLVFFLDKSREIGGADAEEWLSHTREESAFTLFQRIAAGDLSRSLESLGMLLAAKETPSAIFAALASCFRKLLNYLSLKKAGITDAEEFRNIGISAPGAKRDYAAAAMRYDFEAAESCLALTAEYDMRLRSALSYPEHILFGEYLYKIYSLGNLRLGNRG